MNITRAYTPKERETMSTDALEQAIALIQEDNLLGAQKILKEILSINPQNFSAWGWYVKTFAAGEEQVKAMELCLKYNPDNEAVKDVLKMLDGEIIRPKSLESILFDRLLSIVYLIVALLFIGELIFAWNSLGKQHGFGGLPFMLFWLVVLTPQWLILSLAPAYYVIAREKKTPTKAWILKTSAVITVVLMLGEFGFAYLTTPYEYVQYVIQGFVLGIQIRLILDFISSLGIATFLFLACNTGEWPENEEKVVQHKPRVTK